jgi:hypothetical protein
MARLRCLPPLRLLLNVGDGPEMLCMLPSVIRRTGRAVRVQQNSQQSFAARDAKSERTYKPEHSPGQDHRKCSDTISAYFYLAKGPTAGGAGGGCLCVPVLNEAPSEEKSVDEPNDNDGDQNEYPVGN